MADNNVEPQEDQAAVHEAARSPRALLSAGQAAPGIADEPLSRAGPDL